MCLPNSCCPGRFTGRSPGLTLAGPDSSWAFFAASPNSLGLTFSQAAWEGSLYVSTWLATDAQVRHYSGCVCVSGEMNVWMGGLPKVDGPPRRGWASSNPLRAWVRQKVGEGGVCYCFPASLLWPGCLLPCPPALRLGLTASPLRPFLRPLGSDWTTLSALLGLPRADSSWWDFSASIITWADSSQATSIYIPTPYQLCFSREVWLARSSCPLLASSDLPGSSAQGKPTVSTDAGYLCLAHFATDLGWRMLCDLRGLPCWWHKHWLLRCLCPQKFYGACNKSCGVLTCIGLSAPPQPPAPSLNNRFVVQNSVLLSLFCCFLPSHAMIPQKNFASKENSIQSEENLHNFRNLH